MPRISKKKIQKQTENETQVLFKISKAGLYRRLSSEDGEDVENNSIGNQEKIAKSYISHNADIVITRIYTDNGFSGMSFDRPGYKEMMEDLENGVIDTVIVKDISRLGRHYILTSELVEKTFPSMNIRLICINDNYDSADEYADVSTMLLPFKMIMNDNYARDTGKKIRSSINTKMSNGEFLPSSGSIPYGYLRNEEKKTFDIDLETAPVIKHIYELRSEGESFNGIARILNEENVPSPGYIRFKRGLTTNPKFSESNWLRGAVKKICEDPVYIGQRIHGKVKRDRIGENKTRRSEGEWTIIEDAHEPIIEKSLYSLVQTVNEKSVKKRNNFNKREEVQNDIRDLLKDKIVCGDCGSKMTARKGLSRINKYKESRPAFIYYTCNQYVYTNKAKCTSHYIREDAIMELLNHTISKQLQVALDFEELIKEVKEKPNIRAYNNELERKLRSLKTKRIHIDGCKEQLVTDFINKRILREEYDITSKEYTDKLNRLNAEIEKGEGDLQRLDSIARTADQWIVQLKSKVHDGRVEPELIDLLVDKITVFANKEVVITLNYEDPFKPVKEYIGYVKEAMSHAV